MIFMIQCLFNASWTTAGCCCSDEVVNKWKHRNGASQTVKQQFGATTARVGIKQEQFWSGSRHLTA